MEAFLPSRAEEALRVIRPHLHAAEQGLPVEDVVQVLTGEGTFAEPEAEQVLTILDNRGYIYQVDNQIRITPK